MPVDAIKIDRSFVAQLWPDDPAMVLVQGLIAIARQLNVHVVAEGIETAVPASQLWTMGCVLGQGFEFQGAVDRAAMTELLRRNAEGVERSKESREGKECVRTCRTRWATSTKKNNQN